MQVFKCAMRILKSSFAFPLIYIVGFSFISLLMAMSIIPAGNGHGDEFQRAEYSYSIVDRDNSAISRSLGEALVEGGELIEVADDRVAIQDLIAKGHVDYLLIIPAGYQDAFLDAESADELPKLETIVSYSSLAGSYVDETVNEYISLLFSLLQADRSPTSMTGGIDGTARDLNRITDQALGFASEHANGHVIDGANTSTSLDQFVFYLTWGMYPLFTGITICISVLLYKMNRTDVRRRNLSSPLSLSSFNRQLTLSCLVVALISVLWVLTVGIVAFPEGVAQLGASGTALCALIVAIFSLIPTALGFMIGMFGGNVAISNSVGNIVGLAISFFGGAWFSLDLMDPAVRTFAQWLPGCWYTQALTAVSEIGAEAQSTMLSNAIPAIAPSVGIMLLFAAALFCIGLVVSKKRTKTAEAGGNRAAEVAA